MLQRTEYSINADSNTKEVEEVEEEEGTTDKQAEETLSHMHTS